MNTEAFGSIQPLKSTIQPIGTGKASGTAEAEGESSMFADIFQSAIDGVKSTDAEVNEAEYLLATGQLDNPAELTIAATKAQLSVDLLVELRNRALDAYSEISRISL